MCRLKFTALVCALLTAVMLTGCDDFDYYEFIDYLPVENVTARTEFPEYSGDVEKITVIVNNDRDVKFACGSDQPFCIQKWSNEKWRPIKSGGAYHPTANFLYEHSESKVNVVLKDHVRLPLLPGRYRVWVGSFEGDYEYIEAVPAEFTVK